MAVSKATKQALVEKFGSNPQDTGKTDVQIAILTAEIKNLTEHMVANKKDKHSKRGLYQKVSKRRSLLKYLERTDIEAYRRLLLELNLRG